MLKLQTPIIISKTGRTFDVSRWSFNVPELTMNASWKITDGEYIIKQGEVILKGDQFIQWYNEEYLSHEALLSKVAELAGVGVLPEQVNQFLI